MQRTDWDDVRESLEGAVTRLLGRGLQKSREGIEEVEKQGAPKVQEAVDRSRVAAKTAVHEAATGIDRAATSTTAELEKVRLATKKALDQTGARITEEASAAKVKSERAAADVKSGSQDAVDSIRNSGGTVNAARGAVRDVISKGIEKGKEAIGRAQSAVGLAAEEVGSKVLSSPVSNASAVEKALQERYEKPHTLNKSVADTLAERYQPIDSRDNTVLRGV